MRSTLRFYQPPILTARTYARPHAIESNAAVTEDPRHAALLDLLLQGRPDRVTAFLLAAEAPETRVEAAKIADAVAALAVALPAAPVDEAASAALKARIMASLSGARRARSAVLVIDMLNDHLTPGSSVEVPRARDIVPAVANRLEAARASGLPVVYVVDQHDPDDPDLDLWTTHNVAGSKGGEVWPALAPKTGDTVVTKPTYSAFAASELDAVLDRLAVDTLVLTGCLTEVGLLATAMDALQRGYAVEIPPDAQAGSSPAAELVTLATLSILPPFAPARIARLARIDARAATP
jgi:nicotinamidase/pyrazinamidase